MQTGIMEYDELQVYGRIDGLKREHQYSKVIYSLVIQFIHQYVSSIEAITLKVMTLNGYQNIRFSRNELDAFIQGKASVQLSENDYNEKYDRLYNI